MPIALKPQTNCQLVAVALRRLVLRLNVHVRLARDTADTSHGKRTNLTGYKLAALEKS